MSEAAPIAAVDLGSNSFHMIVARPGQAGYDVIDRLRESVRLAGGLEGGRYLNAEARERALACLRRFGERLDRFHPDRVRAVGTNTLRMMSHAEEFIEAAEQALGHTIEVISGVEEGRLIYGAVARELPPGQPCRLVVDIGGGSTEVILGHSETPRIMESFPMGCVELTERFFIGEKVSRKQWRAAQLTVCQELEPYELSLRENGWDVAVGTSGSVRAIQKVLETHGLCAAGIEVGALQTLIQRVVKAGDLGKAALKGLSERRRPVFLGGLAVLAGVFDSLCLQRMEVSDSALREGLLLDLLGRMEDRDQRPASVHAMAVRLGFDRVQSERVGDTARRALAQVRGAWNLAGYERYLDWAAELHEIGRSIAHEQYHKHGAYIVENADLSGFSKTEQRALALLIRCQRGKLTPSRLNELPMPWREKVRQLAVILRIALVLHRRRAPESVPDFALRVEDDVVDLALPPGWTESHPLGQADLQREAEQMAAGGIDLNFG